MMWLEAPAMLAAKSDDQLIHLKGVCRRIRVQYAHIERERQDADRMLGLIVAEQRRRAGSRVIIESTVQ